MVCYRSRNDRHRAADEHGFIRVVHLNFYTISQMHTDNDQVGYPKSQLVKIREGKQQAWMEHDHLSLGREVVLRGAVCCIKIQIKFSIAQALQCWFILHINVTPAKSKKISTHCKLGDTQEKPSFWLSALTRSSIVVIDNAQVQTTWVWHQKCLCLWRCLQPSRGRYSPVNAVSTSTMANALWAILHVFWVEYLSWWDYDAYHISEMLYRCHKRRLRHRHNMADWWQRVVPAISTVQDRSSAWYFKQNHSRAWAVICIEVGDFYSFHNKRCIHLYNSDPRHVYLCVKLDLYFGCQLPPSAELLVETSSKRTYESQDKDRSSTALPLCARIG